MRDELPFSIMRVKDGEELARVADLLLAREIFQFIANVNFPEEIHLKQGIRVIARSVREDGPPGHT